MSETSRWNVVITTPMGEDKVVFDLHIVVGVRLKNQPQALQDQPSERTLSMRTSGERHASRHR